MKKLKRNHFLSVRFSTQEKEHLKKLAVTRQQTLSELVRTVTLGTTSLSQRKFVPQVNRHLYFELGKVSERLQMIQPRSDALNEIQELLDQIGRELIGIDSSPPQHDQ
jgi:hypothetical protein